MNLHVVEAAYLSARPRSQGLKLAAITHHEWQDYVHCIAVQ